MSLLPTSSVSLEEIWAHQSNAGLIALNSAVVLGVVFWEYIQLLPEERSLYDNLRGPEWRSPAPWAFILLRYSALASAVCSVLYSSVRLSSCQLPFSIGQAASIVVVASSGILFCCRLSSMWEYRKIPVSVCAVVCFITTASWITVATRERITEDGMNLPFGSNCRFEELPVWSPVCYALTAAFSCLVFGMTLERMIKICTMVATNTGWTLINRACLVYMLCATIGTVGVLVVYSSDTPTDLLKRTSAPYLVLILMSMGSRVFLNLRLHINIITRVEESNQFTAKKWSFTDPEQVLPRSSNGNSMSPNHHTETRSIGTYFTTTTLTVPDSPTSQTSFRESSYYGSPQSPRSLATTSFRETQTRQMRMNSMRSFTSASTRETDVATEMPDIPKRVRVGSVNSSSSSSSYRTSPRRKPVPSVTSLDTRSTRTASTRRTGSSTTPGQRRVKGSDSYKYFATTSNLKTEELKSTWHGI